MFKLDCRKENGEWKLKLKSPIGETWHLMRFDTGYSALSFINYYLRELTYQ